MRAASILLGLSAVLLTHALPTTSTTSKSTRTILSSSEEKLDTRSGSGFPFWWQPSTQNSGSSSGIGWRDGNGNGNGNNGGSSTCSCTSPTSTGSVSGSGSGSTSGLGSYLPFFEQSECSTSNASPATAPTPLPAPRGTLMHVAIGRGTQNYTCDMSNPSSAPVQVGALATLYNATCLASTQPEMLSRMPEFMLNYPFSESSQDPIPGADALISGHHFFTGPTNPTFGMDTSSWTLGIGSMSKTGASNAPVSSSSTSTNTMTAAQKSASTHGNVPWLYLTVNMAMPQTERAFSEVYRVNTFGGGAPSTCAEAGQAVFEVQYAAEYWFYQ